MPLSLAYVAGLLDGEGCISINGQVATVASSSIVVEVGMTKPALPILRQLAEQFGGRVRLLRLATDKWAEAWHWTILGDPCVALLEEVGPHLQLKVDQARAVMQFHALRKEVRAGLRPKQHATWTPRALEDGATLIRRIRELNRKGPSAPPVSPEAFARLVAGKWVTDQASLFAATGWEPYLAPWPRSGTWDSGAASPLPPSAPPTAASGCSSSLLATPTARDGKGRAQAEDRPPPPVWTPAASGRRLAARPDPAPGQRARELALCGAVASHADGDGREERPQPYGGPLESRLESPRRDDAFGLGAPAWGDYAAAVDRWERILGRRAPAPVGANRQLNPAFSEWMMGLPAGWVTDRPISATAQHRVIGAGVVPQCGAAALADMWAGL